MPYDPQLDERILRIIADWGTVRKKMFGGTCHLINGNMMCGVYRNYLRRLARGFAVSKGEVQAEPGVSLFCKPREAAPIRATLELSMTRTGTRSGSRDRRPF